MLNPPTTRAARAVISSRGLNFICISLSVVRHEAVDSAGEPAGEPG